LFFLFSFAFAPLTRRDARISKRLF